MRTLGDTTCVGLAANGIPVPLYRAAGCDSYARVPHISYVRPDVINNGSFIEKGCLVESTWDSRSGRELFHPHSVLQQRSLLKQISNSVKEQLSTSCYHMRRGLKAFVTWIVGNTTSLSYVFKTDIYSYYQSIHHSTLLETLHKMSLPTSYIRKTAAYLGRMIWTVRGGHSATQGLPKGGSLSPLLGEIYLTKLDHLLAHAAKARSAFYGRYMDDIIIIAKTRHHMRQLKLMLLKALSDLRMSLRPEKTFIGRGHKGFTFLGYRFCSPQKTHHSAANLQHQTLHIAFATTTIQKTQDKSHRCYAQGGRSSLMGYLKRFEVWAKSGLKGLDHSLIQVQLNNINKTWQKRITASTHSMRGVKDPHIKDSYQTAPNHVLHQTKWQSRVEISQSALRRLEGKSVDGDRPLIHAPQSFNRGEWRSWELAHTPTNLEHVWENILCLEGYYL